MSLGLQITCAMFGFVFIVSLLSAMSGRANARR
jgi:hypothetical protein